MTAASALGAGPAPNSFICENLTLGNFKSQFTFKASGANKWSFGNDMSGNAGQNFFIWDEVSAACRFYIDSSGRVGIGTTTPYSTSKLHVAGRVQATGYDTGDIRLANDYSVTEDEKDGVAFLNPEGEKIAVLQARELENQGRSDKRSNAVKVAFLFLWVFLFLLSMSSVVFLNQMVASVW